ncbi:hypothetical protein KUTeg_015503 [Tegillarca granosa]|uniref:Uncharacterized protein n=1 Tax=Tegillarca granosa TaxID=220873 RepID=A0ABQ9EQB1_TEGGR|nr:hypothetical protein KUTeg_015503 [Tegillarca granosa]
MPAGMRFTIIISMALTLVGAGLRCIPTTTFIATWYLWILFSIKFRFLFINKNELCQLINIEHILNGIGLAASTAFPSLLAVTWFPPQQRTTATAMSLISFNVGMSISFILGSKVVQTPRYETVANFVNISIENSKVPNSN